MPSSVTLKAMGLNTSPNQLDLPPGSLTEAKNIIIRRDNTVEQIRGFRVDGTAMGSANDRAKTLFEYRNRIFRHYSNVLQFEDGTLNDGTRNYTSFSESVTETDPGLRLKKIESNGNLYFTSSEGIKKISSIDGAGLSSAQIVNSGGIKAVDFTATLKVNPGDQSSFLPQDSAVAYRHIWATKDANSNLILGAPSQREVVFNPLGPLILRDFHILLRGLDGVSNYSTASLISDGNYVDVLKLPLTATPVEIQTNLVDLADKIDKDILIAESTVTTAPLDIDSTAAVSESETITTVADVAGSLNNKYFYLNDITINNTFYYVWLNVDGTGVDPVVSGKTGISVGITTGDSANAVASKIATKINSTAGFGAAALANVVTIVHTPGTCVPMSDINTGFAFAVLTTGNDGTSHSITSGVYKITFSTGNPNDYWVVGDKIYLDGFTPATEPTDGTLDGIQTIAFLDSTSISINTTAVGPVTVGASATITSGTFRNLPEPAVPNIPAADQELVALQSYLLAMITALQNEPSTGTPPTIDNAARVQWIDPIDITTTAFVALNVTIPESITSDYFLQVYRSGITLATGAVSLDDLVPSDELQLVYEAFPTSAELAAGEMLFDDVTPDEFRGANLYTNPATGEGALQSNDIPPYAKDINRFKNVVFFANTKTRHRLQISLLGVQQMLDDFDMGTIPKISIATGETATTYTFVKGENEESQVVCDGAATLPSSGTAAFFDLYSANDVVPYYVWYKIGTATDPAPVDKTGIEVELTGVESATVVAQRTSDAISSYPWDFGAESSTDTVTIVTTAAGPTTDISDGSAATGFAFSVVTQGVGEDPLTQTVLLSSQVSVALAVDETARSLIRIINKNPDETVYAYYLSGSNDVPGKILLESKSLVNSAFYLVANNDNTGVSFNPNLSPDFGITSITTGSSPTVTTSSPHGLANGDTVVLALTDSTPEIQGAFPVYQVSSTTFKIDVVDPVTVAGTTGVGITATNSVFSANDVKANRIYYSKLSQPEAVPLVNFFDVGDADKAILRIFPLRDSLFVFKEEGLYRISGETAPFTLALFDSSCQLSCPDTIDVNNNLIYGMTTQGIMTVSEGGVNIISRSIDNIILKIPSFTNYQTLSFGMGYESDNSYTLWTVQRQSDESATIGFRFSNLTNSWTTVDRELTCGFINPVDNKSYHGAGDINFLEQERKEFDRYDYAEREYPFTLSENSYNGIQLRLNSVENIAVGDVFVQNQQLTCFEFNMLLKKLDFDPGVSEQDYFDTLEAVGGDNLRLKIETLATKLDADPGVVSTNYAASIAAITKTISAISTANPTVVTTSTAHGLLTGRNVAISASNSINNINGNWDVTVTGSTTFTIPTEIDTSGSTGTVITNINSFADIAGCYNIIIQKLNTDTGVSFSNYTETSIETDQEAIVVSINRQNKRVTLNLALDFVVGTLTLFKAIDSAFTYGPNTFGNPVSLKHVRECQVLFENRAFTTASIQFATDLLPELISSDFPGDGNGIFGFVDGFGDGFFGGASNSAPHRTWVPRQCQRCRYLTVRFNHKTAREVYRIYGITLTGEDTASTRAYRS